MANIEVLNVSQQNPEDPVEIQLSTSNITYRGPAGHDGIIGRDGKSAYEIAVENGFVGTEVEWLASLQGEPGRDGSIGPQGPAGTNGNDGGIGPQGPKGDTPVKGVDYFTEQDIASFIAQVPAPDLTNYKQTLNIVVNNLLKNNSNSNILNQEQQNVFFNLYQKFTQHLVMPDVWINGFHILFYHTTPITASNTTMFYLYSLSYPLNRGEYQLVDGLLYYRFDILVNETQTGLYDGRLGWEECQQKATNIKLASALNIAGHRSSNVGDAISALTNLYASKDYVETTIRGAETGLLKRAVVQELPVSDIDDNTIYMVAKTGSTGDVYNEYLYVNNTWELIGNTAVDLTNYALKSELFSGDYDDLINKPTIPSPYILPNATTATLGGVMVDGSTITVDSNGVISSSSGASYTAGNGISIDSNNVINLLDNRTSFVPILYSILTRNSGMVRQDGSIQTLWNNRFSRANLTYHIDNLKTWRMTYFSDGLVVATWRALVEALEGPIENLNNSVPYRWSATQQADQYTYIMAQSSATLADDSRFNMGNQPVLVEYLPDANVKWVFISYPERLFQNIYFNSQQGLTSHSIAAAIDEVAGQVGAKLTAPTAPSADGSYILKCGVSSGTPTYSWESVVIGGSY